MFHLELVLLRVFACLFLYTVKVFAHDLVEFLFRAIALKGGLHGRPERLVVG